MPRLSSKIIRCCPTCSKEFFAWPKDIRRGQAIFCSRACWITAATETLEVRFNRHVGEAEKNGCILWTGKTDTKGYGVIQLVGKEKKDIRAHRAAYILAYGPIPSKVHVLHTCDTPLCVNVAHLFAGDAPANIADMVSKGRQAKGEGNAAHVLTEEQVLSIRHLYRTGKYSQKTLAELANVSTATICLIVNYRLWKHLP